MVLEYLQSCHSLVMSNRHSLVLFTCLFVSSLPVLFPLMFVLIRLLPTYACFRLRLQPNSLVLQPRDSRNRPSPVPRTRTQIILDILVCRLMTLDCIPFSGFFDIKDNLFFTPEFCLPIGSYTLNLTDSVSAWSQRSLVRSISLFSLCHA